jgi:hypothetical protein
MKMNAPVGLNALDFDAQGIVGNPLDRVDGPLKVTGGGARQAAARTVSIFALLVVVTHKHFQPRPFACGSPF